MDPLVAEASSGRPLIDWGQAGSALEGGESGDAHVVVSFPGGALVALIDGLGHGGEAALAARAAVGLLKAHAREPLITLVQRCHEGLRRTRGAVMSLASFDASHSSITWIGVGNVDGVLRRAEARLGQPDEAIVVRGGVVGYQLPALRLAVFPVSPGDTLVMATDGIRRGFSDCLTMQEGPQEMAEAILARYAKGSDDAHVVVARYLGAAP